MYKRASSYISTSTCIGVVMVIGLFFFITSCFHSKLPSLDELPQDALTIGLDKPLPMDPKVKAGELDNGLHYYIRKNTEPKNRAELRLVINAGSILEDEKQQGLAHFIEHMAFQGTEQFEKQKILDYMKSIGMKIGSGINAFTGQEQTIFKLQLPTDDVDNLITALRILRDWATGIKFDPEEIESERKIVIEEWRQSQGAKVRVRDEIVPIILKDSMYARRLPIGTLENLQNFRHEDLIRFYRDWYRPDLMAVIAVGDFDTAIMDKLINEQFHSIPIPEKPIEKISFPIPEHDETLYAIAADPELTESRVTIYYKSPKKYDLTVGGTRKGFVEDLYIEMLNARFDELSLRPDPPFTGAGSKQTDLVRPLTTYIMQATVLENGIERGFESMLAESVRIARFGFTPGEFDRKKMFIMRRLALLYENRESLPSSFFTEIITKGYLTGEFLPDIEFLLALARRFMLEITLDEVNQAGRKLVNDSDRVIVVTLPEKPDITIPSLDSLKSILASIGDKDIEPYKDTSIDETLLTVLPKGCKVIEENEIEGGLTEWKLANGIRVILKPTDFKEDEVIFTGFKFGGTSLAGDDDFYSAATAGTVITASGLGEFNFDKLQKKLSNKVVNTTTQITDYMETVSGIGSSADLETLFQLIYMRITAPRADKAVYKIIEKQMEEQITNRLANPRVVFNDTFLRLLNSNHPRKEPLSLKMIDKMDLEKSLAFYKERFEDAGDFIFIFVGSFDSEQMRPLVETYIGALPGTGRNETWKDVGIRTTPRGIIKETVRRGLEPISTTRIAFTGDFIGIYDIYERGRFKTAIPILQNRLRNLLRESMGGTYSVKVDRVLTWLPVGNYMTVIEFSSDPERADELAKAIFSEIRSLKESGPTEGEVADAKQELLREYETGLEQNKYWLESLYTFFAAGVHEDASQILLYPDSIKAVTAESMQDTFQKYYDFENYIQVSLLPEVK